MPRKNRLDFPGALHQTIAKDIEKKGSVAKSRFTL